MSVAPFGAPVVPEVNWMLIGSSNCSCRPASARLRSSAPLAAAIQIVEIEHPRVVAAPSRITISSVGSPPLRARPAGKWRNSGASSCSISNVVAAA